MSDKTNDIPDFLKNNPSAVRELYGENPNYAISVAAEALNEDEIVEEDLPKPITDDELHAWVKHYLNIDIPRNSCSNPDHVSPFKAFSDAYFARHPRTVWWGSRGFSGKSVLLSTLALTEALSLGASVTVLGGSGEQSQRVLEYTRGYSSNLPKSFLAAESAPRWLLRGDPTKRKLLFKNGGLLDALMASDASVRGPHPMRLRGDEVDSMAIGVWDAANGQPMESRGIKEQVVGSSTWQNPQGTMTREFRLAKEYGWPCSTWCWRCVLRTNGGWLDEAAVDRKRQSVPRYMWEIEYDLAIPLTEGQAFDDNAVDKMFDKSLGHYPGKLNDKVTIEAPESGATYATAADWGKARDKTWILTFRTDVLPFRLVAFAHLGRLPFPDMVEEFNKQVKNYTSSAVHDAGGIGAVIHDYLDVFSEGIHLIGKRRNRIFSEFIAGVERGEILCPMIDSMYNDFKYTLVDDLYSPSGHPPDSVVAGALAYEASNTLDLVY